VRKEKGKGREREGNSMGEVGGKGYTPPKKKSFALETW